ncbi:hypothetical protein B9479_007908 [Cryptococcus floricola]|uniref:Amino acid transporter transmembrane domain-containing protein n=1 Tax=Cryptococcus floricola TaxID=2591691 RepID=A0A5D3AL48_9TREE|nr:hypothetical protein B9479_007908 [Cryptococcus floricola]
MSPPPPQRESVPIPPNAQREHKKNRSGVLQSSLELVFSSYSRSQQLRYGASLNAPSFLDDNSFQDDQDLDDGEDSSGERHVSSNWDDIEARAEDGTRRLGGDAWVQEVAEDDEDDPDGSNISRRVSDEPSIFHADGMPLSTARPEPPSMPIPPASQNKGLISVGMFSPRPSLPSLPGSYTTSSSVTQTPHVRGKVLRKKTQSSGGASDFTERSSEGVAPAGTGETAALLGDGRAQVYDSVDGGGGRARARIKVRVPAGQSTEGQTLFNATAVLVGIGLLSLPLAFAYAGWICGSLMLFGFGWLTCYTAKLLSRIIRADMRLTGYTDIGLKAFGRSAGIAINFLFCLELFALGVALVVLFGDTLNVLFPHIPANTWKLIGFFIVAPTALLPLHILSLPSLLSSLSSLLLILVLLIDGLLSPSSPGSLLHPMPTSFTPELTGGNWLGGVGLVLAGFGGHAVMPSLARDMRRPEMFEGVVDKAFAIATGISFIAGASGYLMIGSTVSDEITKDLMQEKYHYPRILNIVALWMIVINPLTKFGLSSRPLNITLETILGISPSPPIDTSGFDSSLSSQTPRNGAAYHENDHDQYHSKPSPSLRSPSPSPHHRPSSPSHIPTHPTPSPSQIVLHEATEDRKATYRVISRIVVTAVCVGTAVVLPGFGRVMAFLGSFSAFVICIILPLLFHLRLAPTLFPPSSPSAARRARLIALGQWVLVAGSVVLMVGGTVWAFLPGSGHGELDP